MAKIAQTRDRLALAEQENEDLRERLESVWEVVDQYRAFVATLPAKYRAGAPPVAAEPDAEPDAEPVAAEPDAEPDAAGPVAAEPVAPPDGF